MKDASINLFDVISSIQESRSLLHGAWARRLRWHYDNYNYMYANYSLKPPIFCIGLSRERLGQWDNQARTITIAESHILSHSWESVLETLRHEMAHQYVSEVFFLDGATPHGEAFAEACRILRADSIASADRASLGSIEASQDKRDQILVTIQRLLALAGSPNEHEAARAMSLAHKYLLKYNLQLADLDGNRKFQIRHLGKCACKIQEYEYSLADLLQDHFFVKICWIHSYDPVRDLGGRILQACGTPENLEIAEYVYKYVSTVLEDLWRSHKRSRKCHGATKFQYLAGVVRGLKEKLDAGRSRLKNEQGLIWIGDARLEEYYQYLNPKLVSVGGYGVSRNQGYESGLGDGRKIAIHRAVNEGSVNRGRLLK